MAKRKGTYGSKRGRPLKKMKKLTFISPFKSMPKKKK